MRSHDSKPRLLPVALLSAPLALALAACSDGSSFRSPTAPDVPTTPPAPTATPPPSPPPATDVTGSWSGTVTVTWDEMDGGGTCVEPVNAQFTQSGAEVSGVLTDTTECGRDTRYTFEGLLVGNALQGKLIPPGWATYGQVAGDRLTLWAFNVFWELRR